LPRILLASLVMGASLWLVADLAMPLTNGLAHAAALLASIAGAIAIYALLLAALGVTGWRESVAAIRQRGNQHA